jgi:hypothetical protein
VRAANSMQFFVTEKSAENIHGTMYISGSTQITAERICSLTGMYADEEKSEQQEQKNLILNLHEK